jgi:omega-6 fatty acid desaturase (delta-12 desaturase)
LPVYGTDVRRSVLQLAVTGFAFLALLAVMLAGVEDFYWLTLMLTPPAAGLLVRLFIFQHDCGHGSYFRTRRANDILGRCLSVFTLTAYEDWKRGHALHHATSGNLDRRGRGDVTTLTVREYEALSPAKRLGYRLYRHPLIMVLIGAPLTFIVFNRLPFGRSCRDKAARRSKIALDLALIAICGVFSVTVGLWPMLTVYLPVMIIGSWVGGWLFYVQHQFDGTYWQNDADWSFHEAGLNGSSYFVLPKPLRWFSGNIGLHHIHHLCSRIPNYQLPACLEAFPELRRFAKRITLRDSFLCWNLALWDEELGRLVSFREQATADGRP